MQRLLTRGRPAALANTLHDKPMLGYSFGVAMFVAALLLRMKLVGTLPPGIPFITFLPAMLVVAFLAGPGPAILSSFLSGIAAWYLFVAPEHSFAMSPQIAMALIFFWGVVAVGVLIIHSLRKTALKLDQEREINAELANQRAFLFRELQHRVANNMSFLVAILSMQKAAVRAEPMQSVDILDDAIRRIRLFSSIHRRLHEPDSAAASLESHFRGLFDDLVEATDAKHVTCTPDIEQIDLSSDTVMTLSLVAAELMTNAIKHAFEGRESGKITITLRSIGDEIIFRISDNGMGNAEGANSNGLGCKIVDALSEQLGAQKTQWVDKGRHVELTFAEAE